MTAVVIGGGLAGLVAALRLAQACRRVTLLEATTRLGGMIAPIEVGGVQVDAGAEAFAVRGGGGRALCEELGLTVAPPQGRPHVYWPDGTWPMADGVLGIPASIDDPALGVLTDDERAVLARDAELGPHVGSDAATVGHLVRSRLGEAALAKLVAPVATGVYSLAADKMPLAAFAPGLLAAMAETGSLMAAVATLRKASGAAVEQPIGGMHRVIPALQERMLGLGGVVRTSSAAVAISHSGNEFVIGLPDGERLLADRLVIATPGAVAAALLARMGVEITVPATKTVRQAVIAVRHPGLADAPIGSGLLVGAADPAIGAKAITHYSLKWPWAAVEDQQIFRLSYPDQRVPHRPEVIADASQFLGVTIRDSDVAGFAAVTWETMPGRLEPPAREHIIDAARRIGVDVVGAWLDGNGISSVVAGCGRVRL